MELDELKKCYNEYDKKLTENLKLNEELLKKMSIENYRKEIKKPFIYEIINLVLCFFIFIYFITCSFQVIEDMKYSLSGFASATIILLFLISAFVKVNKFAKLDYYNNSIMKLQRDLNDIKRVILFTRRIELFILPIVIVSMFPILFKLIYNINIYTNLTLFASMIIIFLIVCFFLAVWINRNIYDRKLQSARDFLEELNRFENDDNN